MVKRAIWLFLFLIIGYFTTSKAEAAMINLQPAKISGDKPAYCQGDIATLSEDVPLDPSYTINWYVQNTLIAGDKNKTKITTTTNGTYQVVISSTTSNPSYSNGYLLDFILPPTFKLDYPATLQFCAGATAILRTTQNESYQYRWYKDGALIADASGSDFPTSLPGSYTVQVSSCPGGWVAAPNSVQISFIQIPIPTLRSDKPAYCVGDTPTLSIDPLNDPTYTVQWYRDYVLLPQYNGSFNIPAGTAGSYMAQIVGNFKDDNGNVCTQNSNAIKISFGAAPTLSIQQTGNNALCNGQPVSLTAVYNSGSVKWSTGETSDQITVTTAGTYSVTLTTPSGCTADKDIVVGYLPDPVLPKINDVTLCVYKKQTATITAPPGFVHYSWNNQDGGETYTVSQIGTVILTVTDANGCPASEKINVVQQCSEVDVPNTFTPNGDNVNDTWVIQGLDNAAKVSIFTRYGTQIFKSIGYTSPWDGTYKGKKVPSGAYYYIINTKSGTGKYSGVVMVVY